MFGSDFGIFVVRPSEVYKKWVGLPAISTNLMVKSKLPPQSGSSFEAVEPHPWKRDIKSFFHKTEHLRIRIIDLWLGN